MTPLSPGKTFTRTSNTTTTTSLGAVGLPALARVKCARFGRTHTLLLKFLRVEPHRSKTAELERQAAASGATFRHDAAIFPCLEDGSRAPLALRVSPAEAVRADLATPERRRQVAQELLALLPPPLSPPAPP